MVKVENRQLLAQVLIVTTYTGNELGGNGGKECVTGLAGISEVLRKRAL